MNCWSSVCASFCNVLVCSDIYVFSDIFPNYPVFAMIRSDFVSVFIWFDLFPVQKVTFLTSSQWDRAIHHTFRRDSEFQRLSWRCHASVHGFVHKNTSSRSPKNNTRKRERSVQVSDQNHYSSSLSKRERQKKWYSCRTRKATKEKNIFPFFALLEITW